MSESSHLTGSFDSFELGLRLAAIFLPHAKRQTETFYTEKGEIKAAARFVHYTTAEAALKIIRSKRVWMRNTMCMADYREVQHGFEMLQRFFGDPTKKKEFYDAMNDVSGNLAEEAIHLFDQWWANIRFATFITSISEHDAKEDLHGRLSMWRAFGGNAARVAIVLRIPWRSPAPDVLNVMFSPVAYLQEPEAHSLMAEVTRAAHTERDFLRSVDRQVVLGSLFNMLVTAVTCWKHEGFQEEREWRVIYAPQRSPSSLMESSLEVIGGIPQIVYKLPLDAKVSEALSDLDAARVFDRLIIGPSEFSGPMYNAFTEALGQIGVEQPEKRVFISAIPIRS